MAEVTRRAMTFVTFIFHLWIYSRKFGFIEIDPMQDLKLNDPDEHKRW